VERVETRPPEALGSRLLRRAASVGVELSGAVEFLGPFAGRMTSCFARGSTLRSSSTALNYNYTHSSAPTQYPDAPLNLGLAVEEIVLGRIEQHLTIVCYAELLAHSREVIAYRR